jgi:hypothetical protein
MLCNAAQCQATTPVHTNTRESNPSGVVAPSCPPKLQRRRKARDSAPECHPAPVPAP